MRLIPIAAVALNASGYLRVTPQLPALDDFAHIYRAAFSARWDDQTRTLYALPDSKLDLAGAFNCILVSAADEYDCELALGSDTQWIVPLGTRQLLEGVAYDFKVRLQRRLPNKSLERSRDR